MKKQGAKTATPRLRFPEFRHHVGFGPAALGRAFGEITNGKANAQDHKEGGAFPLFDRSEVIKASSKFAFDSEAVILPGEGMSFRPRYFEGKFDLHQRAYALMECQGHSKYFYYALDHAKAELALKAVKSTVLSLRLPIIEKFAVFAPPDNAEQQKIADCLTSLDEVIAAQGRKVEALKAHKRGLMQQLFPREGETRPRLRFPEFRDAPEWRKNALKDICIVNPSSGELPDSFFYIDLESVEEGLLKAKSQIEKSSAPSRAQRLLRKGDVLFQTVRPYQRNNLYFAGDCTEPHVASTGYAQLRAKDSAEFLYQIVHTDAFVGKVIAKCTGSNYPAINSTDLAEVVLFVPKDPAEQQRIADCLDSLDAQITAESNQLAALKTHKQGLMQQLFPAPEATGA